MEEAVALRISAQLLFYEKNNCQTPKEPGSWCKINLLNIVLYSYMNGDYSLRSMELNCKRDINFMFLLEGAPVPDHAAFARFRSIHFAPCAKRILAEMSNTLFDLGEIFGETIFIDGTKIEVLLEIPMLFRRYLSKGAPNVLAESTLFAMARNINKLHNKIQKGRTGTHLFPLKIA